MARLRLLTLGMIAFGAGAVAWAARPATPEAAPAVPKRVVSFNLCADQLIVALADRAQIAGLTRNAIDSGMSAVADRARGLPLLSSSGEQILAIQPDLVVGMPAGPAAALIARQGYPTLDFRFANTVDEIYLSIRETAAALGHPARGEAMIARMQGDLAAIPRTGRGRVAAFYQRRGFMTGTGTLVDDLMRRAGLVNLAAKLGKPPLAQVSIEEMVAAKPDFLIVDSGTDTVEDQGTEMLHHPALRDIPRVRLPSAWTVCAGPAYVQAARSIAAQVAHHR
ncbi:ABC transporter substrate-binding protein [Sphingomonas sp. ST-64]|uniref:ABC transporter substrate-binding protein n=1 Tax=Sphingomonas plantiphila TaxID=3163295 RepID=A0ABW8YU40_9SPHN